MCSAFHLKADPDNHKGSGHPVMAYDVLLSDNKALLT
jgi:hypothetical protein